MSTSTSTAAPRRHRPSAARRTAALAAAAGTVLAAMGLTAPNAHAADSDTGFSSVVFNNGEPVVVGISAVVEASLTYSVKTNVALDDWEVEAYRGTLGSSDYTLASSIVRWGCSRSSSGGYTYHRCEETVQVDPDDMPSGNGGHLVNGDATAWKTVGTVFKSNGSYDRDALSATVRLQRASRIVNMNASPEPVTKGATITVIGTVQRANWSLHRYDNYGERLVKLQFRPAGSSTYNTVKSVTAGSTGHLKTTVTASQDGTWRWRYSGNTTTGASNSSGDTVDVK